MLLLGQLFFQSFSRQCCSVSCTPWRDSDSWGSCGSDPADLHRMHCASSCLCIFLAFIGQERARPAASHALCDIVPVFLLAFIGQERARASEYHASCPATVVRTTLAGDAVLHPCCSGRRANAWRMAYARWREMAGAATWVPRRRPGRPRCAHAAANREAQAGSSRTRSSPTQAAIGKP